MNSTPSYDERVIGLRLTSKLHQPLEFTQEEISQACLAEMTRTRVRPILTMEEINERGRQFMIVSGFATYPII